MKPTISGDEDRVLLQKQVDINYLFIEILYYDEKTDQYYISNLLSQTFLYCTLEKFIFHTLYTE